MWFFFSLALKFLVWTHLFLSHDRQLLNSFKLSEHCLQHTVTNCMYYVANLHAIIISNLKLLIYWDTAQSTLHVPLHVYNVYKEVWKGLHLPGGTGSNNASHALILSKKPLRVFSVCNKKWSSLKQRKEKCT